MRNNELKKAIEMFGNELSKIAGDMVKNEPKVNTGRLKDSFRGEVKETAMGTSYTLLMWAEDYFVFVDEGRKKNSTPPPVAPIKEWCASKGIEEGAAYAIAKAIGKNGIPATNISKRMMKQIFKNIAWRKFEDDTHAVYDDMIVKNLKGLSRKGNITFK